MSDYLSRTADRAEPASAPAVRPRLASRYENAPEATPVAAEREAVVTAAPNPGGTLASPGAKTPRLHVDGDGEIHPDRTDLSVSMLESSGSPPVHGMQTETSAGGPAPLPERVEIIPPPAALASALASGRRMGALHGEPASVIQPAPDASPILPAPRSAGPASVAPSAPLPNESPALKEKPVREAAMPAPARSDSAAPLLEFPRTAAPRPLIAAAPAAAEQRTINITIGRLEIRAATPAPQAPRARPSPPGRGPLPLDEYLRSKSPRRRTGL